MSSHYSSYEIEKARQERLREQLKRELQESVRKLREQTMTEYSSESSGVKGKGIEISVFLEDQAVVDDMSGLTVTSLRRGSSQKNVHNTNSQDSGITRTPSENKYETEAKKWILKAEESPVITLQDHQDKIRLLDELNKIFDDVSMDTEDKAEEIKMRVHSFLSVKRQLTSTEKQRISDQYYLYCVLCERLDITPTLTLPFEIDQEIERMTSVVQKKNEDEYAINVIEECMNSLGCHVVANAVLDNTTGQLYEIDGTPLCSIFIGDDGCGLMYEPIGEFSDGSLEKKRTIEKGTEHVCSLHLELEEMAAEKGVILNSVYHRSVTAETMCVKQDINIKTEHKKRKKAHVKKAAAEE